MPYRISLGIGILPRGLPIVGPADTTPDAFSFTDVTDADLSTVYESDEVTITGLTAGAVISISGADGEYSKNGGGYTDAPGMIANGDEVKVRLTSSAAPATAVAATLTIGGVSDTFTVTTEGGGDLDFSDPAGTDLGLVTGVI
jgi:hypothetical protein